ncbi:MAG: hypothetical protein ACREFC_11195 [Stellaceae bacterium]
MPKRSRVAVALDDQIALQEGAVKSANIAIDTAIDHRDQALNVLERLVAARDAIMAPRQKPAALPAAPIEPAAQPDIPTQAVSLGVEPAAAPSAPAGAPASTFPTF